MANGKKNNDKNLNVFQKFIRGYYNYTPTVDDSTSTSLKTKLTPSIFKNKPHYTKDPSFKKSKEEFRSSKSKKDYYKKISEESKFKKGVKNVYSKAMEFSKKSKAKNVTPYQPKYSYGGKLNQQD
jgi:hypothetical protein